MGKLFWKFFFYFWLAQVTTMLGVSGYLWWNFHSPNAPMESGALPDRPLLRPEMPGRPPASPLRPRHTRFVLPLAVGTLASVFFAGWLAWRFSRPVRSLRDAFREIANGRLDTRAGDTMASRGDELAELGMAFDRMAVQLQRALDNRQRLLHDVSHELRSPLARLQAITGLMRQHPQEADQLCDRLDRESARMDQLLGELLTLSRLDAGPAALRQDDIDLGELLDTLVDDNQPSAKAAGVRIEWPGLPHAVRLTGDAGLLYRAVDNLLRNAIQHSLSMGAITVTARLIDENKQVILDIVDQGPGVPANELSRVFEPFFRASNNGKHLSGSGLGLAMVQKIVHSHGGTMSARNNIPAGFIVSMTLPVSTAGLQYSICEH